MAVVLWATEAVARPSTFTEKEPIAESMATLASTAPWSAMLDTTLVMRPEKTSRS